MDGDNSAPIIIKKGKKKGEGHHGGAWKVAYADFVTAMMALFIVLWILGQSEEVKESVSHYFNNPTGVALGSGPSALDGRSNTFMEETVMYEMKLKEMETERLKSMGESIIKQLEKNATFLDIMDQIDVTVTDEGLRIELMETNKESFFDLSTAVLKDNAEKMLTSIGEQLSTLNNKIVIEGHTDSRQFPGGALGYTNYELSTDRANTARRTLVNAGIQMNQIDEVRGYADNRLINPDDPFDASNRRISIIVKFSEEL
ncbi:MAG: flagellar motor protein MotB [Ignavibacteria bacterium]|jgi:chemotaxis protein MotB